MPERQAPQTSTSAAKSNPASAHHASTPNFEVERKYRLQDSELGAVREQLVQMGFRKGV